VSTSPGCPWTAASNNRWIHVTGGSSGNGSGTVSYSVDANSGSARTGSMTIAGRTFTVSQAGGGGGQSYTYQVAGIAHAGGAGGSVWRSTLCVTNRSGATANLTLVYRMAGNTVTRTYILPSSWIKEWEDVAASLFNQGANTSGSVEITSDAPLMVVARTYNQAPDGTFGQGLPGNPDSEALTFGQLGVLPQLKKTSMFRTNVGFMNHGSAACNVRVRLYSETGTQIGSTIDTSVPAMQWKQINDVFGEAGVGQCPIGYATVEVRTAGGMIWTYGSVVDNGTGDPTTILPFVE
jgi:Putative binding domain, N-terminal